MLKDLIRALSLANLCFIVAWNELLDSPIRRFNTCLAIIVNVMLLGALFWIVVTLARRSGNVLAMRLVRFFFLLVALLPLNGLMQILLPKQGVVVNALVLVIALAVVGVFEIMPWYRWTIRGAEGVVIVLFPFFLVSVFQATWALISPHHIVLASPVSARSTSAHRVLLLIFDELDEGVTFAHRPATLQLPELDRFRSQALYATNAYPPSDSTLVSLPALTTGRLLTDTRLVNQSKMIITFADTEKSVSWSREPNVFSEARAAGFTTALVSWYGDLPSCDLLGENLTQCVVIDSQGATLCENISKQIDKLLITIPFVSGTRFGIASEQTKERDRKKILESYLAVLDAAKKVATDSDVGLGLLHLPIPHPPAIYRRDTDEFEVKAERSYVDNLRLVDRTLGDIRHNMEESGTWDNTTILLTSDHWWRRSYWRRYGPWVTEDEEAQNPTDHRVPFILKLAGQKECVTYDPVFNNVLTHDLILGLLRSELSSPDSIVHWLDQHRSIGETPYLFNLPK